MQRTNIDWILPDGRPLTHTWNPITGCKRGCTYCYARRIHERFNKTPFSDVAFHPERLGDPFKHQKPAVIFVGSMSDPEYWHTDDMQNVLDVCKKAYWHEFMFLSKSAVKYAFFKWSSNCMQGLTLDLTQDKSTQQDRIDEICLSPRPFLSVEPVLGPLLVPVPARVPLVIVGAMTGPGAIKPKQWWIESIKTNCKESTIHWKKSIA